MKECVHCGKEYKSKRMDSAFVALDVLKLQEEKEKKKQSKPTQRSNFRIYIIVKKNTKVKVDY